MAEAANLPKLPARQGTKRRLPPASDASLVFELLDWCAAGLALALVFLADYRPTPTHFLYACAGVGLVATIAHGNGRRYFLPNGILWLCCALLVVPYVVRFSKGEPYLVAAATAGASLLAGARLISACRRLLQRRRSSIPSA